MKSLSFLDYAVIAAFFAVMIGVGVYYSRKSKSSDQFFGNDKTVPWWLSGVSFYMNSFSALATILFLVIGTCLFPDTALERESVESFMDKLSNCNRTIKH